MITPVRRSGTARVLKGSISQFYLNTPCTSANRMNHTCLRLPSQSWYSFTDPGEMEGWVGLECNFSATVQFQIWWVDVKLHYCEINRSINHKIWITLNAKPSSSCTGLAIYISSQHAVKSHRQNGRLCRKNALGLTVTLTFDLWPWKPFTNSHTWRLFVLSFTEIPPLSTEVCEKNFLWPLNDLELWPNAMRISVPSFTVILPINGDIAKCDKIF